ncbi:MAG: hemolysin III family protein [Planctomycetaceae bacterium]|nr:hemolysin III family protein [Planctomycetaceae bacterium]
MSALPSPAFSPVESSEQESAPKLRVIHPDDFVDDIPPTPEESAYSATDEALNFRTHLVGFGVSVIAAVAACWASWQLTDIWVQLACLAYGLSQMAVYGFSTLSHAEFPDRQRHLYRTLDQVSIFLFIAASSTPFMVVLNRNPVGMSLLAITWALALVGVGMKLFVKKRELVPVWYYVVVGWFPGLSLLQSAPALGAFGLGLLLTSAATLTTATWFLCNDHKATWFHGVWHVMVLFATVGQFVVILRFVLPYAA